MILALLLGCATTFLESHCEFEVREVVDDERLDELDTSVARVLLPLVDPQEADAIGLDGGALPLVVTVARADGMAVLDDATVVTEKVSGSGRNSSHAWVGEEPEETCRDLLEVPVALTLSGEGVSVSGPASLWIGWEGVEVVHALDLGTESLPAGLHGAPVSGEVRVRYGGGTINEIEGIVTAQDGARETVLWYRAF
ncbi:MAG: hypothetical protein V4850_15940 [Myxococcota bacterium]